MLEKFLNLGEWPYLVKLSDLKGFRHPAHHFASCLTGDDRNIVEVFVAGRKVVPFVEPNQAVL